MEPKRRVFEARVTLGELIAAVSILVAGAGMMMRFENRFTLLESSQLHQDRRLDRLEQVTETATQTQADMARLLGRMNARP